MGQKVVGCWADLSVVVVVIGFGFWILWLAANEADGANGTGWKGVEGRGLAVWLDFKAFAF